MTSLSTIHEEREEDDSVSYLAKERATDAATVREKKSSKDGNIQPSVRHILRIFKYATAFDIFLISISLLSAIGAGLTTPIMYVFYGHMYNDFNAYGENSKGDSDTNAFLESTKTRAMLFVYLFIAKFVCDFVSMYPLRVAGLRISGRLRRFTLRAIFDLPIAEIDKLAPGSVTNTLTTISNNIQMAVSERLAMMVQGFVIVVGSYVVSFVYSWQLTLAGSTCVIVILIIYAVASPMSSRRYKMVMDSNRGAAAVVGEILKAIRTVKSLAAEITSSQRHLKWVDESKKHGLRLNWVVGCFSAPMALAYYGSEALVLWLAVRLFVNGTIPNIANVIVAFYASTGILSGWGPLLAHLPIMQQAAAASVECFRLIDSPKRSDDGLGPDEVNSSADIRFENVHFAYPGRPDLEILKGLSMILPAGKVTALVGPSGSGKSTIVALLERWYDLSDTNEKPKPPKKDTSKMTPTEQMKLAREEREERKNKEAVSSAWSLKRGMGGVVKLLQDCGILADISKLGGNGSSQLENRDAVVSDVVLQNSGAVFLSQHNIETIARKWLRTQIGLVQQEPVLYNDTIFYNVAVGLVGSEHEDSSELQQFELVREACIEAFAHEFIENLPDGYGSIVGEGGVRLSGGQRQRIAIARSIVKKPAILILDEATSSIDIKGERIVQAALDRASKGRTTIAIAHRLSTIQKADKIIVLKDGRMVESGTHNALIKKPTGVYCDLVKAQHLELGDHPERDILQFAEIGDLDLQVGLELPQSDFVDEVKEEWWHRPDPLDEEPPFECTGLCKTIWLFACEQRRHWLSYIILLVTTLIPGLGAAGQSFLQAKFFTLWSMPIELMEVQASFWALIFVVLAAGLTICGFVSGYVSSYLAAHIGSFYRQQYFESVLYKRIAWFDKEGRSVGELTNQLSNDPTMLQQLLGAGLTFPILAVFQLIAEMAIALAFGWKLALVTMAAALPLIVGAALVRAYYEMIFAEYSYDIFQEASKFAAESVSSLRTVTAFTLEECILYRYKDLLSEHVSRFKRVGGLAVLMFALADSVSLLATALAWWYGGTLVASGAYNLLQFYVVEGAVIQGSSVAGQLLAFFTNTVIGISAANRILEFRGPPEVSYDDQDEVFSAQMEPQSSGMMIEFCDVGFAYPCSTGPVYSNLSFKVPGGGYAALVGPSGCGKSTVIGLLMRFYSHQRGDILADGEAIVNTSLVQHRRSTALVSQEPMLFDGTVRENLVIGMRTDPGDAAIEAACRSAEIHDFIVSLDLGYGTSLSSGTHASLSGGQKQRLCIARALLRRPRLLLLDEATSSLDSQSETLVKQTIDNIAATGATTVIVVAHRLSTVQNAGKIIVLGDSGKVVEQGTHPELIAKYGVYASMCRAQALDR